MDKKIIRLTESDLHKIVKESVTKILNEDSFWTEGQAQMYKELNDILREKNPNAWKYLQAHKHEDGVIEDMYSILSDLV